ncbi:MAG: hypothetical protein HQL98_08285 [Magnetococcales bacterium]|nr:hypothetical protein [Magnetococcales bacterium]
MMISNSTAAVVSFSSNRSASAVNSGNASTGFGPEYQVDLSSQGVAFANPASGVTESKMRNVLTRILLETLFGADASAKPDQPETSEEEMVREVVLDPLAEEKLQEIAQN